MKFCNERLTGTTVAWSLWRPFKSWCFGLFFIAFVICPSILHGQSPVWLKHYGGTGYNQGLILVEDGSGGFYGTGAIGTPGIDFDGQMTSVLGSMDILLARWDVDGNAIWARTAGADCAGFDQEIGSRVAFDPAQQHVIISGKYNCSPAYFGSHLLYGSGNADMFVAAYDDAGECVWANGVNGTLGVRELLIDDASDIHVIGTNPYTVDFPGPTSILPGGFVAKYGVDGEFISAQRALTNGEFKHAGWLAPDEWVLTGFAEQGAQLFGEAIDVESPVTDGFVAQTSIDGTVAWITTFRSSNASQVWECATTLDGRINVAGYFLDSLFLANDTLLGPPGVYSFFLASLSDAGAVEWVVPISSPTQVFVYDLKIALDGDVYAFGRFMGPLTLGDEVLQPNASVNGFVARFNSAGVCLGAWDFGRIQSGNGSVLPLEGGLLVSCDYDSAMVVGTEIIPVTQTDIADLFIAKFDSLSGFTGMRTSVLGDNNDLHIYANPSNGLCTIELPASITPGAALVLSLYDVQGRVVQQQPLAIQSGTVQLDIRAQAKGFYHVELQGGARHYSGTIVFE